MSEPKCYGVIIEHKCEQPLMLESPPMSYDVALARMNAASSRTDIIRVAMFKITHVYGNETLIEKDE